MIFKNLQAQSAMTRRRQFSAGTPALILLLPAMMTSSQLLAQESATAAAAVSQAVESSDPPLTDPSGAKSHSVAAAEHAKPPEPPARATAAVESNQTAPLADQTAPLAKSSARELALAFRTAAEKALPAVVTVLTRTRGDDGSESGVLDVVGGEDQQVFDSVGSGVIISDDGLVLTNHHVVDNSYEVVVRLPDGREYIAEETQSDPMSDVAILRIPGKDLPVAELGDSNALHVGDWVLAIGSPFTLESSVSAGIVSDPDRVGQIAATVQGIFIQTDAAINPGNSGGPLVDLDGNVIGINTSITSRSGVFQGVGFAIPITRANWIRGELLEYGRVRRAFAGVRTSDVYYQLMKRVGLERRTGAWVRAVTADYPAAKAGVRPDDIILSLNGHEVDSAGEFREIVQQSDIGEPLQMIVLREGQRIELTIKLQERPTGRRPRK